MRTTTHRQNRRAPGRLGLVGSTLAPATNAPRRRSRAYRRALQKLHTLLRPEPGYRRLSLYTRVVLINSAVLGTALLLLALTPATVSFSLALREAFLLVLGVIVIVVANSFLIKVSFRPLVRLVQLMRHVDLLQPGQRLRTSGGPEVRQVIRTFNEMVERLERERRDSNRRAITARETERRRMAQELHDEIGQRLTGLLLRLGRTLKNVPTEQRAELLETQELARKTLDEVGRLAWQLRPGILDDLGLVKALRSLVSDLNGPGGPLVELHLRRPLPSLDADAELALYRVAQEATTNAVRHAGAGNVDVTLATRDAFVLLQVADDGKGLDGTEEGPGLRGMRERALLVGAALTIESLPGVGTTVTLELRPVGR
jgi:two-component system sensor histidine kinase UhpB